jgi:hypothetical protein
MARPEEDAIGSARRQAGYDVARTTDALNWSCRAGDIGDVPIWFSTAGVITCRAD